MKIGKKLLLALLSLSLISLLLSTVTGLYQLSRTKRDIETVQNTQARELTDTNIQVMTEFNADMVITLAQNYSEILESKFNAITSQVMTIRNYLKGVYENGKETISRFPDDMHYLQPDVVLKDIEGELQVTKSVRDIIASTMEADSNISAYYVSESGILLADRYVDYASGSEIDRRTRPWYIGAVEERGIYWTPIYTDALSGEMTITCSVPVLDEDDTALGVVACDILVGPLIEKVLTVHSDMMEYTFLLDGEGLDFVGSISDKTLADFMEDQEGRSKLIQKMLESKEAGLYEDGMVMVGYAPITVTGWNVGVVINYQKIVAPARDMSEAIRISNNEFHGYLDERIRGAILISALMALVMIGFVLLMSGRMTRSITKPLELLTQGVGKVSEGDLHYGIDLKSGDELEQLANAFNTMTRRLREHIDNLAKITAEKERIATELNVATQIQADMLPNIFPAFPEREEFEIYATMQPAKEVGGDFYDFFMVDDDHLGIVIADVSGKSVPAALFMVIAKTLINNRARANEEPQDVFINVNKQLCEGNETAMFVTAWMGVLEIGSGKMTVVNAGHNPPLLKRADGQFEYLKTKKGFVLAGLNGFQYKQLTIQLNKGDTLYLYTDGVTEANNTADELYGEKRLQSTLNRLSPLAPMELLPAVKADIDLFTEGTPQFDDITMLALRLKG